MRVVSNKIRVFLVDDHILFRESLAGVLGVEPDLVVVGEAGTAAEALKQAPRSEPDVILVDLNIPDRDGVELLETLRVQLPCAKLLVLSAYQDAHRVQEALQAGADGYLVKTTPLDQTLAAIRDIAGGGTPFSSSVTRYVVDIMRRGAQPAEGGGIGGLSKRELQVFRLLAEGLKTRETAARLTISHKTVETHRIRIYKKLQVNTPAELTRIAVRAGILEP